MVLCSGLHTPSILCLGIVLRTQSAPAKLLLLVNLSRARAIKRGGLLRFVHEAMLPPSTRSIAFPRAERQQHFREGSAMSGKGANVSTTSDAQFQGLRAVAWQSSAKDYTGLAAA